MRLAISNIAWAGGDFWQYAALAKRLGCDGVELAASLIWPEPVSSTKAERFEFQNRIIDLGLNLVGLHALLFTRPDLRVFGSGAELRNTIDYLKSSCELCRDLGGKTLAFGSPKNRRRGVMPRAEAFRRGADFFRQVCEAAAGYDVLLLIEPLGSETDFVRSSTEALDLIEGVAHPNFQLLLDAKALVDVGEDPAVVFRRCGDYVRHFHASEPNLAPPGSAGVNHALIARELNRVHYRGYVSIEMRNKFGRPDNVIPEAVRYVRKCYGEMVEP